MSKTLYHTLLIVLALIFLICGWKLLSYFQEGRKTQNRYDELAAMVEQARPTEKNTEPQNIPDSSDPTEPSTEPEEEGGVLREYRWLYESNPDMVGWIMIEDTVINYPVVQTPDDPEYYLHRDFDGQDNARGCLFADVKCDVENSDNVIIYGHHMNDGSMFGELMNYGGTSGNLEFLADFVPLARCDSPAPSPEAIRRLVEKAHKEIKF